MIEKKRKSKSTSAKGAPNGRATERYRLALPTLMWELGESREHALPTETGDISRSGLFLRGEFPMRPGAMISFEVQLPHVGEQPGGKMVGQATIVRRESSGGGRTGIGAMIHQCEVWPAHKPAGRRSAAHSSSSRGTAGAANLRAGRDRRTTERRQTAASIRLKVDRRQKNRRTVPTRRKG